MPSTPLDPTTRIADWQADIDFYAKELPRRHIDAFAHVAPEQFRQAVAALRARVPDCEDMEIFVGLMQVTALVRDGHTQVYPSDRIGRFSTVPVATMVFTDGVFVTHTMPSERELIGLEVVAVGGVPIDEVRRRVATALSHENQAYLDHQMRQALMQPELLHALGVGADAEAIEFTVRSADGATRTVRVPKFVPPADGSPAPVMAGHVDPADPTLPISWRPNSHRNWFAVLPAERALYVHYGTCSNEKDQSVARFTRQVLDTLEEHTELERVIVDLRRNGGGNSLLAWQLLLGLRSSRFNDPDRLAVLIGRATFSSAQLNAQEFRDSTRARLYGGPTGQKPNAFGEIKAITLPQTGVILQYSTAFFETDPADPPSMMPDVLVESSSVEYFAKRDPVLEAALAGEK